MAGSSWVIGISGGHRIMPQPAWRFRGRQTVRAGAGRPQCGSGTVAGDGVYVMGFLPSAEVSRVAAYAMSQGLSRFAVQRFFDVF